MFTSVFDDAAIDWRLIRVSDGAGAARYVMDHAMPELVIISAQPSKVSGPELAEWLRSFRSARPLSIIVYDAPFDSTCREQFLQNEVSLFLSTQLSRKDLIGELSRLIDLIERRLAAADF